MYYCVKSMTQINLYVYNTQHTDFILVYGILVQTTRAKVLYSFYNVYSSTVYYCTVALCLVACGLWLYSVNKIRVFRVFIFKYNNSIQQLAIYMSLVRTNLYSSTFTIFTVANVYHTGIRRKKEGRGHISDRRRLVCIIVSTGIIVSSIQYQYLQTILSIHRVYNFHTPNNLVDIF